MSNILPDKSNIDRHIHRFSQVFTRNSTIPGQSGALGEHQAQHPPMVAATGLGELCRL